jgi:hypothetical protein
MGMRRFVLVAALTPLLVAPPAQAAGLKVTWPAKRTYAPGEQLVVKVASRKPVRVAFVRESARGRIMRTIARKTLRTGTFSALAPSPGRYAVRVGARHRAATVAPPAAAAPVPAPSTPAPPVDDCFALKGQPLAGELHLLATSVASGGSLPYEVVNTGATCVIQGAAYGLERQLDDRSWSRVALPWAFPSFGVQLRPSGHYAKSAQIPANAVPGNYRVLDDVTPAYRSPEEAMANTGTIPLAAPFTVTG